MSITPESAILQPRPPTLTDENAWPEFTLTNADVCNAEGDIVSLLTAEAHNPVVVTGTLAPVEKEWAHLQNESPNTSRIAINGVIKFAYGQSVDDDGKPTGVMLWAAGEAGWFKLEPSRRYKETYYDMVATIERLYFLVDVFAKRIRTDWKELCIKYAEEKDLVFADDAEAAFYEDRKFLIHAILKDEREHNLLPEECDWGKTSFYEHMRERFPADFAAISAQLNGRPVVKPITRTATAQPQAHASASKPTQDKAMPSRPRGRPRKEVQPPQPEPPAPTRSRDDMAGPAGRRRGIQQQTVRRDEGWWKARAILEFMQKASTMKHVSSKNLTLQGFAAAMVKLYEIDDEATASNYISTYAGYLVPMMETKRHEIWSTRPIYTELQDVRIPVVELRRMQQLKLQPRRVTLPIPSDSDVSSDASTSEDEEEEEDVEMSTRRHKKGRLSIMKPKPAKKAAKKRGKGPSTRSSPDTTDEDEDAMDVDSPSKRRRIRDDASEILESGDGEVEEELPLRWKREASAAASGNAFNPVQMSLLPVKKEGEADVWTCSNDQCNTVIYAATSPSSQQLIAEHEQIHDNTPSSIKLINEHVETNNPLVSLVQSEARPYLPVSHLLKKLQGMANVQDELFPNIDGGRDPDAYPKPVRQRY